jgi:hypothetical protein
LDLLKNATDNQLMLIFGPEEFPKGLYHKVCWDQLLHASSLRNSVILDGAIDSGTNFLISHLPLLVVSIIAIVRAHTRLHIQLLKFNVFLVTDQLQEIRKTKLARVICDNTDLIDTIQIYPMVLPDHEV